MTTRGAGNTGPREPAVPVATDCAASGMTEVTKLTPAEARLLAPGLPGAPSLPMRSGSDGF
jgi:hypothetical protein